MFYLYLKTHSITGLKYLGYTKNDPYKYRGSGLYWKRHLKEYGNHVSTEILFESESIDEISECGLCYSKMWDVANNESFANLCEEDGNKAFGTANPNFKGHPQTEDTRKKISQNNGRGNKGKFGEDHPAAGHKVPDHVRLASMKTLNSWVRENGPWNKGKIIGPHSTESNQKRSLSASKEPKPSIQCPHCGKTGGKPVMIRFHFDKCKGNNE